MHSKYFFVLLPLRYVSSIAENNALQQISFATPSEP
jgi:hypothetical protein